MKTELMLLMQTDGRPTMNLSEIASLLSLDPRTVQNKIYAGRMPFPVFKLGESGDWVSHISDVAAYIDRQREAAAETLKAA
ncbi:MAG: pyocin activator protein PrtN [Variovorax paradoxus]|uniref:Pyocin activator protein PrtN n=1 Tax=Variovorax paradoxus TaxID=34073 RepID=A0A2W5PXI6_VARPD|nr:MAG: pyocin activator protein PrtN [Variovorax paradoxus]